MVLIDWFFLLFGIGALAMLGKSITVLADRHYQRLKEAAEPTVFDEMHNPATKELREIYREIDRDCGIIDPELATPEAPKPPKLPNVHPDNLPIGKGSVVVPIYVPNVLTYAEVRKKMAGRTYKEIKSKILGLGPKHTLQLDRDYDEARQNMIHQLDLGKFQDDRPKEH